MGTQPRTKGKRWTGSCSLDFVEQLPPFGHPQEASAAANAPHTQLESVVPENRRDAMLFSKRAQASARHPPSWDAGALCA